jgi:hypothetical protein
MFYIIVFYKVVLPCLWYLPQKNCCITMRVVWEKTGEYNPNYYIILYYIKLYILYYIKLYILYYIILYILYYIYYIIILN